MMLKYGNRRVQSGDSKGREGDLFIHEGAKVQNIATRLLAASVNHCYFGLRSKNKIKIYAKCL